MRFPLLHLLNVVIHCLIVAAFFFVHSEYSSWPIWVYLYVSVSYVCSSIYVCVTYPHNLSIEYRVDYLKVCIYSEYSFGTFVLCRLESTWMQLVVVVNIVHGLFIFCCCSCKDNAVRCLANGDDSIRSQIVCVSFSYAFFSANTICTFVFVFSSTTRTRTTIAAAATLQFFWVCFYFLFLLLLSVDAAFSRVPFGRRWGCLGRALFLFH